MHVTVTWRKEYSVYKQKDTFVPTFEYHGEDKAEEQQRVEGVKLIISKIPELKVGNDGTINSTKEENLWWIDFLYKEGKLNKEKNKIKNFKKLQRKSLKYSDIFIR